MLRKAGKVSITKHVRFASETVDDTGMKAAIKQADSTAAIESEPSVDDFVKSCYKQGVYYLQHMSTFSYLPDILKNAQLLPAKKQAKLHRNMGGNPWVVYLDPYQGKKANTPVFDDTEDNRDCTLFRTSPYKGSEDAVLIFSVRLLAEMSGYYANKDLSHYGRQHAGSVSADSIVSSQGCQLKHFREICFRQPIDLSKYLVEVWVDPARKDELVDTLKKANLSAWVPKIVGQKFHPQITPDFKSQSQRSKDAPKSLESASARLFKRDYPVVVSAAAKVTESKARRLC